MPPQKRTLGRIRFFIVAAYRRGLAIAKPKAEADRSDVQAQKDCRNLVIRIGEVAFDLLRARAFETARVALEEAVSCWPECVWLRLIYAHALMFCANISGAMRLHREHHHRILETGESWGAAIRNHFAWLRKAGVEHPVMKEIKRQFAAEV